MTFAILRRTALLLAFAGASALASAAGLAVKSPQARVAATFLRLLESGQAAEAHKLLETQVAHMYPAAKLGGSVVRSRVPTVRQLRSEHAIASTSAYANKIDPRYASAKRGSRPSWVVCFADVPRSGYGRVSYVAVILVANPGTVDWKVSDYHYRSEPDPLCKG